MLVYLRHLAVGFGLSCLVGDVGDGGNLADYVSLFVVFRNGIGIEYSPHRLVIGAGVVSVRILRCGLFFPYEFTEHIPDVRKVVGMYSFYGLVNFDTV